LLPALDVLLESLRDGVLFRPLATHPKRLVEQAFIDSKVGRHVWKSTHAKPQRKAS
jgi:hypothetical protein